MMSSLVCIPVGEDGCSRSIEVLVSIDRLVDRRVCTFLMYILLTPGQKSICLKCRLRIPICLLHVINVNSPIVDYLSNQRKK